LIGKQNTRRSARTQCYGKKKEGEARIKTLAGDQTVESKTIHEKKEPPQKNPTNGPQRGSLVLGETLGKRGKRAIKAAIALNVREKKNKAPIEEEPARPNLTQ